MERFCLLHLDCQPSAHSLEGHSFGLHNAAQRFSTRVRELSCLCNTLREIASASPPISGTAHQPNRARNSRHAPEFRRNTCSQLVLTPAITSASPEYVPVYKYPHACMYMRMYAPVYTHITHISVYYIYIYICMHTHTPTCINVYTHIQILSCTCVVYIYIYNTYPCAAATDHRDAPYHYLTSGKKAERTTFQTRRMDLWKHLTPHMLKAVHDVNLYLLPNTNKHNTSCMMQAVRHHSMEASIKYVDVVPALLGTQTQTRAYKPVLLVLPNRVHRPAKDTKRRVEPRFLKPSALKLKC